MHGIYLHLRKMNKFAYLMTGDKSEGEEETASNVGFAVVPGNVGWWLLMLVLSNVRQDWELGL